MNYKQRILTSTLLAVTALAGCVTDPGPIETESLGRFEKSREPMRNAQILPGDSSSGTASAIDHTLISIPDFPPPVSIYAEFESCISAAVATFKA